MPDLCKHLTAVVEGGTGPASEEYLDDGWWGFGGYRENLRPRPLMNTSTATPVQDGIGEWLSPALDPYAETDEAVAAAYRAALSARFEHGESGAPR